MTQLNLIQSNTKPFYGGSLIKGNRKTIRPLSTHRPIHLTLKCNKGLSLFNQRVTIQSMIERYSTRFGIKIYGISIQIDHIHLVLVIHDRNQYKKFIRTLTGMLARKFGAGLFKVLPFTRLCSWGKDYHGLKDYLLKNDFEVWGLQAYQPRKDYYHRFRNQ